jgi:5-methylthioadenosine/S-adenosylhomocysteine deaminase
MPPTDAHEPPSATEPVPVDLLVTGGHVVTADAAWTEYADGAIAIAGGRIVSVGPSVAICAGVRAGDTLDASGCVVVPGLIDAHLHPGYPLVGPAAAKRDWSKPGPFALGGDIAAFLALYGRLDRAPVREEETHAIATLALLAALKSGTTCWSDGSVGNADGVARASLDLGLRGIVTYPGAQDLAFDSGGPGATPRRADDVDALLARGQSVVRRWNGEGQGRLRAWYMLASDISCSDELITATKALADRDGVCFSSHTCTVENEIEVSRRLHGRTGVARLAALGALGPNWVGIHMGYADDTEIALMAERGGAVVHCPGTSMGVGKGILARRIMPKYMAAGVPVALGSDTSNAGTALSQLRLAYYGHKEVARDDRVLDPRTTLAMVTSTAARVLHWDDEIGSLEAGKRADLSIFRCDDARWAATPDPVAGLCRVADAGDVEAVVVDGRVLVRNSQVTGVDEAAVIAAARAAIGAFLGRGF